MSDETHTVFSYIILYLGDPCRFTVTQYAASETCFLNYEQKYVKVQTKFFFIAEFERTAKIRKIAVYRFLIIFPVPKVAKKAVEINQNQ